MAGKWNPGMSIQVQKISKSAGIDDINFHALRTHFPQDASSGRRRKNHQRVARAFICSKSRGTDMYTLHLNIRENASKRCLFFLTLSVIRVKSTVKKG
jgi:hypothetical protein